MFTNEIRQARSQSKLQNYKTGHILPVLAAKDLLAANSHQGMLNQIKEMAGLSEAHYEELYTPVINNFSELIQVIPAQANGPLSGLLNQSLARAWLTFKNYIAEYGLQDPLYNYAVFTAALLFDVSKVIINQKIFLSDEEGNFIREWNPFEGTLVGKASLYKIYSIATVFFRLQHSITPLLARQLLPQEGFLWLSDDMHVFADWLDALRGDDNQGGRISRALALVKREDIAALANSLLQVPVDMRESPATEHGDAFLNWLKEGLVNGDIKVNTADAGVFMVNEGTFIDRKLFKQFADVYNAPVNMNVVFTQFGNALGIAKKGGGDFVFDQFFSENAEVRTNKVSSFGGTVPRTKREGILIADSSIIFSQSQAPAVSPLMKSLQKNQIPPNHQLPGALNSANPELKLK